MEEKVSYLIHLDWGHEIELRSDGDLYKLNVNLEGYEEHRPKTGDGKRQFGEASEALAYPLINVK